MSPVQRVKKNLISTSQYQGQRQNPVILHRPSCKCRQNKRRIYKCFQIFTVTVTFIFETLKRKIGSLNSEREISRKYSKYKHFRSTERRVRGALLSRHWLSLGERPLCPSPCCRPVSLQVSESGPQLKLYRHRAEPTWHQIQGDA